MVDASIDAWLTAGRFTSSFENKLSERFSFRTNLGSAWRTPNMAELYSFGSHGFKNSFGLLRYYYNENNEIFKIEERIDTLHLAEGNIGPRI